jgi:membrane-associated protease RseP (regulator of RpoE activity)
VLYTLGVLAFAFGLLASIALHEIGHMVPAKAFGVRVTQYMVGFGPTLWSKRRGETEYGVKAIPLGGYIRMIGMIPPRQDGTRSRWPRRLAQLTEDFRATSRADVQFADDAREFYRLPPWKKIIIMVGGPSMNLLIYLVLTVVLMSTVGLPQTTNKVGSIERCVLPATAVTPTLPADGSCPAGTSYTPASKVLKVGDRIVAIDGTSTKNWSPASKILRTAAGRQLTLTVLRAGKTIQVPITPVRNLVYVGNSTKATESGYLGVGLDSGYAVVAPSRIPGQITSQIGQGFAALGAFPSKIGSLFGTVFEGHQRDVNGAVGVVGLGRIGGQEAASHQPLLDKIYFLLMLLAGVNLLLFLFNLVPLLPLDGGHVAGAIWESIRRRVADVKAHSAAARAPNGVAPPRRAIYVDTAQMVPVLYGVAVVLLAFTALVVYADIVHPISFT